VSATEVLRPSIGAPVPSIDIGQEPAAPPTLQVGARAPDFEGLLGTDGRRHRLSEFAESEVLVLVFASNRCPTVKAYAERLRKLQAEYGSRGVQLVLVNSNDPHLYPEESYPGMVERAAEDRYTFPYLFDDGQRVGRAYGPTRTFEIFALDRERRLRYHGRFDDARLPERVTTHDLADALDDLLAGREVRVAETRPFGCSLDLM
jgi:peroxiredoxin